MNTDQKLKDALVAQLNFWVGRSAENIQVLVKDGAVALRGWVPCYEEKLKSVETVQCVGGVKTVADEIAVKLPKHRQRTDAEIMTAAANAINWTPNVPRNSIKLNVEAGRLFLEGIVECQSQREAVEYAVRHLPGITGITNLIAVIPQPTQSKVKAAITSPIERKRPPKANKPDVDVVGAK